VKLDRARLLGRDRARPTSRLLFASLVAAALAQHCSSAAPSADTSCAVNPLQCGTGETFWVKDCTCPSNVNPCAASACTAFDLTCMPSNPTAMVGQDCTDKIGEVTCGDGQWCVQEMNVNGGYGVCSSLCDPTVVGSCAMGYSCVGIGVALVASAPVIHVCQVTGSDAGLPSVGEDGGEPDPEGDAAVGPDSSIEHQPFDGGPIP
jgi:hypothetical protein